METTQNSTADDSSPSESSRTEQQIQMNMITYQSATSTAADAPAVQFQQSNSVSLARSDSDRMKCSDSALPPARTDQPDDMHADRQGNTSNDESMDRSFTSRDDATDSAHTPSNPESESAAHSNSQTTPQADYHYPPVAVISHEKDIPLTTAGHHVVPPLGVATIPTESFFSSFSAAASAISAVISDARIHFMAEARCSTMFFMRRTGEFHLGCNDACGGCKTSKE